MAGKNVRHDHVTADAKGMHLQDGSGGNRIPDPPSDPDPAGSSP